MSGETEAQRRAMEAVSADADLTPLGTGKVRGVKGSRYVLCPKNVADGEDIQPGDEYHVFWDASTNTLVHVFDDELP